MPVRFIFLVFLIGCIGPASGRVIHTSANSCIFTIDRFCPIESIGATLIGAAFLGLVFGGFRWIWGSLVQALQKPFHKGDIRFSDSFDPSANVVQNKSSEPPKIITASTWLESRGRVVIAAWENSNHPPIPILLLPTKLKLFLDNQIKLAQESDPIWFNEIGFSQIVSFFLKCICLTKIHSDEAISSAVELIAQDASTQRNKPT